MIDQPGYTPRRSFSPKTLIDIRSAKPAKHESYLCVRERLRRTYDLNDIEVRLLIATDDEHIDRFGRIAE